MKEEMKKRFEELLLLQLFKVADCNYCHNCYNCYNCYMCVGLENKKYCILNEQYTKEEYEKKMKELRGE